jgi:hypothetical protein
MQVRTLIAIPLSALLLTNTALAEEVAAAPSAAPASNTAGIDIGLKAGTLGLGLDLSKSLGDKFAVRLNVNQYDFDHSGTESGIDYDMNLKWQNTGLMLDWHPFGGGFRVSAGYVLNSNKISMTALPTGGTYTIGGNTYDTTQISSLTGEVTFSNGGYLGLGYGKGGLRKGFGFTFEVGVLFQDSPKINLTATGSAAAAAESNIQIEEAQAADSMKDFKLYPQVAVGVSYGF